VPEKFDTLFRGAVNLNAYKLEPRALDAVGDALRSNLQCRGIILSAAEATRGPLSPVYMMLLAASLWYTQIRSSALELIVAPGCMCINDVSA
jgi:hypothetical protein